MLLIYLWNWSYCINYRKHNNPFSIISRHNGAFILILTHGRHISVSSVYSVWPWLLMSPCVASHGIDLIVPKQTSFRINSFNFLISKTKANSQSLVSHGCTRNPRTFHLQDQAPVRLTLFRSNSKFDQNLEHCSLKHRQSITTKFCTRHDSHTVVTCPKFRCDR